ncbi:hypothetical protein SARC_07484 [Sphaeroforma arctica JP610]|uniref:Uncharacterized protein n=1 Tax=Sphaeroforma arctica JP610 TaxID=667725 RepID=A0A0L0FTL0_9EUKA|nr:hypothetical protein SARC_07484 [Sphaeroforma arctica JP610]KNC80145.1 hypothetical protein SARC_07484 [Sphaeroforma arctica JP610]|eukprot:XP_014154047.1 hypothetical protein SARC_07484 [Sphaeroforma arctica JP610]
MSKPRAKSGKKSKSHTNPHARKSANPKHAEKTTQLQQGTRWSRAEELDLIAYNINCDVLREELRKAKLEKCTQLLVIVFSAVLCFGDGTDREWSDFSISSHWM